ncbi:MAG: CoA-binding protein [Anaerolineae bacterium]
MSNLNHDPDRMRTVLKAAQTIAVVGHSDKSYRTSYRIADYLRRAGYTVIPVNPTVSAIDGITSYPSLLEVPVAVDIVNVFRRSEHLPEIVEQAIAISTGALWTQLGVIDTNASTRAREAGLDVAMNLCIKVEHVRLGIASH